MDISGYSDILFFAVLAGVILYKLYFTVGKKGNGTAMSERIAKLQSKKNEIIERTNRSAAKDSSSDWLNKLKETTEKEKPKTKLEEISDPFIKKSLEQVMEKDKQFSVENFLKGARLAFEMVLEAYQKGDKKTLEMLLDKEVCDNFVKSIEDAKKKDLTEHISILGINSSDITSLKIHNNTAYITVKFSSDQIDFVKDKEGRIIEGNPIDSETIEDIWTFRRELTSSNPNWIVVETSGKD